MANELDVLLAKVEDPALRADLLKQIDRLRSKQRFGLVFEDHVPERVRLPHHPVRRGLKVVRRLQNGNDELLLVEKVANGKADLLSEDGSCETVSIDDLVVVAEFGEAIYPGFRQVGALSLGDNKPAHVVINGENHHVLESLRFTHSGKVDCIYIDPPYNTGARDWKYDNRYVDADDAYRHSKWLAFMNRRLRLAKELLNPDESVLVVMIDEKEYLRLGLLLQQIFPESTFQMVSIVTNPKGTARSAHFSRVDEFAFFVFLGSASIPPTQSEGGPVEVRWKYLRRNDIQSVRETRPRQFYPIYVDPDSLRIVHLGEPLKPEDSIDEVPKRSGAVAVLPIREDGLHMNWGLTAPSLKRAMDGGYVRVTPGTQANQAYTIAYLTAPNIQKAESGVYEIVGKRADGSKIVMVPGGKTSRPTTAWRNKAHDAGAYGTSLLQSFVPGRKFPFPKSLYAVEDTLHMFLADKPEALVVDFFGGSGTTTHAVARLNRRDGGRRQSILVTNNEVSEAEAKALRLKGHGPGDPEWEAVGIYHHVTKPRIEAAVTGVTHEGNPVSGEYKFSEQFPMSDGLPENVAFFELLYLDPNEVELDMAFEAVAPLLWMRAGCKGKVIENRSDSAGDVLPFAATDHYGVLFDTDFWRPFITRLPASTTTVFIVTDSPTTFTGIVAELPPGVESLRLYENYLTTFTINQRGR